MLFEQLFDEESGTCTYLLGDPSSGRCALVDPVRERWRRDLDRVHALGLRLVYTLETHLHADHISGSAALAARTGSRAVLHERSPATPLTCQAMRVCGDQLIAIGALWVRVVETPGHTPDSVSYRLPDRVLTGDALLIGGCGRTDLQGGDAGTLFDSVRGRLFPLPDDTLVFPGHAYGERRSTTIGEERRSNPRLARRTRDEFVALMATLSLPLPRRLAEALPANLTCGALTP